MTKVTVVMTGGSGFLGHEVKRLLKKSYKVKVISVSEGKEKEQTQLQQELQGATVLVHIAAVTNTNDPDLEKVNIEYTETLIAAAKQEKIKKVVYISSENVTYNCQDPYTQSKKRAEEIVVHAFPQALIIRPSIIFGKTDKRYLTTYTQMIQKWPIIPVVSKKISTIQPVYVEDVAQVIKKGIDLNIKGIYTIVGTSPKSMKEIGKQIATTLHKKRIFVTIPAFFLRIIAVTTRGKRVSYRINNLLIQRHTTKDKVEETFKYRIPSFEKRIKELVDDEK